MSLTFSPDAKALLAGFFRGQVKLWQVDGPSDAATFLGPDAPVQAVALLPDGRTLVAAGPEIRFWNIRTRHEKDKLSPRGRGDRFICVAVSPDGRRFAAGAGDGLITIWDVASHQEVATLRGHREPLRQLAFTPDGDYLVSASRDQLRIWRAASLEEADP
jgi:WD40 repeat protein